MRIFGGLTRQKTDDTPNNQPNDTINNYQSPSPNMTLLNDLMFSGKGVDI